MAARAPSRQEAIQAVGAYIVATCERRLELRGRKWEEIRNLVDGSQPPPAGPRSQGLQPAEGGQEVTVRPGDPIDGWAISRDSVGSLADILHHCCLPLRFEPENGSLLHRGIASPGAKYPIDVRLHVPGLVEDGGWLKLDAHQACLFETASTQEWRAPDDAVRIVLSGDIAKCLDPYGDMSASLVALEAGMTAQQIALFARAFGWAAEVSAIGDAAETRACVGIPLADIWPLVEVRLADLSNGAATALERVSCRPSGEAPLGLEVSQFPLLERYRQACEGAAARGGDIALARTPGGQTSSFSAEELRQLCRDRTSGAFAGDGRPDEIWSDADIEKFQSDLAKSQAAGPSEHAARFATVHLSFRVAANETRSIDWEPASGRFRQRSSIPGELATLENWQASFIATFGVDDAAMLAEFGPRGHLAGNALVGMLCQRITLAVTSQGRDARALGAYDGIEANRRLSFDRRAILQLKACRSTRPNPPYQLG